MNFSQSHKRIVFQGPVFPKRVIDSTQREPGSKETVFQLSHNRYNPSRDGAEHANHSIKTSVTTRIMTHLARSRKRVNALGRDEMKPHRNHYFLLGVLFLLVGLQFRVLERVVLNPQSTLFLAQRLGSKTDAATAQVLHTAGFDAALPRKEFESPRWCGWAFFALGSFLILHRIMLPKPS